MDVRTIHSEPELDTVVNEWRALHLESGRSPFTDPAFFIAWWDIYGRSDKRALHITTGHAGGRLVALAPLVVVRRYGFRFLEWAATNVFDYQDTLFESHANKQLFWDTVRESPLYDLALIRGIDRNSDSYALLSEIAKPARSSSVYGLALDWASEQAWMEDALSRSRRQYLRRKRRLLEKQGTLSFQVHSSGKVPDAVLKALCQQKRNWASQKGKAGLFNDPNRATSLLERLAEAAEAAGTLHLSWLCCDKEIIAVHLGFLHHNTLHYYMPSYSADWTEFSPGAVLLASLIGWCISNGIETLDFMKGNDSYKISYANRETELVDFLFPGSLKGGFAEWGLRNLYFRSPSISQVAAQ